MKLVVVGSYAFDRIVPIGRTKKDFDFVATYDDIIAYAKFIGADSFYPINNGRYIRINGGHLEYKDFVCEAEVAWPGSSAEDLMQSVKKGETISYNGGQTMVFPELDFLYTLKMSHRFLKNSPHFEKTMSDIHHMRSEGAKIPAYLEGFYERRQKATYTYSHPKLNQSKKDFFSDDGIKYVYDHDSIHLAVKCFERPAYTYFKDDQSEVQCSRTLFEQQHDEIKLASVYEEACVLAIERSLVTFPGVLTPIQAFNVALMKVCTSITSGWWREYAWENYYRVKEMCDGSFWTEFQSQVNAGNVKPFTGKAY